MLRKLFMQQPRKSPTAFVSSAMQSVKQYAAKAALAMPSMEHMKTVLQSTFKQEHPTANNADLEAIAEALADACIEPVIQTEDKPKVLPSIAPDALAQAQAQVKQMLAEHPVLTEQKTLATIEQPDGTQYKSKLMIDHSPQVENLTMQLIRSRFGVQPLHRQPGESLEMAMIKAKYK